MAAVGACSPAAGAIQCTTCTMPCMLVLLHRNGMVRELAHRLQRAQPRTSLLPPPTRLPGLQFSGSRGRSTSTGKSFPQDDSELFTAILLAETDTGRSGAGVMTSTRVTRSAPGTFVGMSLQAHTHRCFCCLNVRGNWGGRERA